MKRVIITGATGTIGTALVHRLIEQKIEILVIMRPGSKRNDVIPDNPLIKKIYASLEQYESIIPEREKNYDVFYHLAWMGASGSGRNNLYLQNDNVKYALDAVALAKRFGCHTFIGAGSQAEYGRVDTALTPDTPTNPEMGYGYAKLCAGYMTRDYAHSIGLKHIWMRILSVYGPYDGDGSMVMSLIHQLKKGDTPNMTKGEQMWDYLYSGDAAEALYLVGLKGIDGKVYVLGSGSAKPLSDYIECIRSIISPNGQVNLGAVPYSEKQVIYLKADIESLTKDTGWKPKMGFKDGIKEVLKTI